MRRGRGNNMRFMARMVMMVVASALAVQSAARAQEMQLPKLEHVMRGGMSDIKAEYPRLGRAQERAQGHLVTLEQAQKIASESNPTLRQAEAEIRATKARQQKAGIEPGHFWKRSETRGARSGGAEDTSAERGENRFPARPGGTGVARRAPGYGQDCAG